MLEMVLCIFKALRSLFLPHFQALRFSRPYDVYSFCQISQALRLFCTLESGIDVGQEINVGPGKFAKKTPGP